MIRLLLGWVIVSVATPPASAAVVETGELTQVECPAPWLRTVRANPATRELARSAPASGAGLRMAIWGDSHTASHAFAEAMLSAMDVAAHEVQPTFMAASWATRGVSHPLRSSCASNTWRSLLPSRSEDMIGAGMRSLSTDQAGSVLAFDFRWPSMSVRVESVRLHLSKPDPERTLLLAISADGGPETLMLLRGDAQDPLLLEMTRPAATLRLRLVAGELTVHGISPAYLAPTRHTLDVFSYPGATLGVWLHSRVLTRAFRSTRPEVDLVVLQYGTNDAVDAARRIDEYAGTLLAGLRRFRLAYPAARCVLVGPPDRGGRSGTADMSQVHAEVARLQRNAAQGFGCDFWDWQAQMGGRGSAAAGATGKPPSMLPDLVHMTAEGYRDSGRAFGLWLARSRR